MVGVVGSLAKRRFAILPASGPPFGTLASSATADFWARPRYSAQKNLSMIRPAICLPRVFA